MINMNCVTWDLCLLRISTNRIYVRQSSSQNRLAEDDPLIPPHSLTLTVPPPYAAQRRRRFRRRRGRRLRVRQAAETSQDAPGTDRRRRRRRLLRLRTARPAHGLHPRDHQVGDVAPVLLLRVAEEGEGAVVHLDDELAAVLADHHFEGADV